MSFDALSHKLNYLGDQVATPTRVMIMNAMQLHLDAIKDEVVMTDSLRNALTIDLLYGLFRHRTWISTPIFGDIMVEFITTEYRIPQSLVRPLVEETLMTMSALLPDRMLELGDYDFLEYLFVVSATAQNERDLILDLGIGKRMVATLKSAAATSQVASFVPEIDADLAEIMADLARQAKELPWILDVYRLRYQILSHGGASYEGMLLQVAFDAAAHTGSRRSLDRTSLIKWICGHEMSVQDAEAILKDLENADIIYCSDKRGPTKSRAAVAKYSLTKLGYELTAHCYVRRYFHRVKDPLKRLQTLPDMYQKAAIEQLNDHDLMICMLEQHEVSLTPAGMQAALTQIIKAGASVQALQIITDTMSASNSPWLRKACWECMVLLQGDQDVAKLLSRLRDESSPLVKQAAVSSLIAMGKAEYATEWIMQNPLA